MESTETTPVTEVKHEWLKSEDYYESRGVSTRDLSNKYYENCGETITKGEPHDMHHFYPDFNAYATHKRCSDLFIKSLN